jgi:hypothetical protein
MARRRQVVHLSMGDDVGGKPALRPVDQICNVHRPSKSLVAQKKLFLNAAYLLREMAISSENCRSLRRLLSSGSVVK